MTGVMGTTALVQVTIERPRMFHLDNYLAS